MPLDTETIAFETEIEAIDAERQEYAEQLAETDSELVAEDARSAGQTRERFRAGLLWLSQAHECERITLGAPTHGERELVFDAAEEGVTEVQAYVAVGSRDAPWVAHDPDAMTVEAVVETATNVADLHPSAVDWLNWRIGQLDGVDGETGKSFRELVWESASRQASQNENG